MAVEGGIVPNQVTASLDGLNRLQLNKLRALIGDEAEHDGDLREILTAIYAALKEWDEHDDAQTDIALGRIERPASPSGLTPGGSCRG